MFYMAAQWLAGPQRPLTRFGEKPIFAEGLYRIAQDSYAWMVPNGSWGETNIGLLDCGGESVLIDTCWDLRFTSEMLKMMQPITGSAPITCVINTHADGDHCWGNQLFAQSTIIASKACVDHIHHTSPLAMTAMQHVGRLSRHLPIRTLSNFGHYMNEMLEPYDFRGIRVRPATETFEQQKLLNVKGVELLLMEVGPGHTDGDIIVYVPERRVAYTGDILFAGSTPVAWAGPVENIVRGLQKLMELDVDVLVPGHGPLATHAMVKQQIDYWDFLQEHLHLACQRGIAPQHAVHELLLSSRFKDTPFAKWDSPERAISSAFTLYRHWGFELPALPGKLGILNVMRHQAGMAMCMPHATPSAMHCRNPKLLQGR
jgi:glyoxylase-like metal-dependent hydrolase (beta-lactamase superfamily II)